MSREQFEHQLAYHCALTIKGLKAASMVAFSCQSKEMVEFWLNYYKNCFKANGLNYLVLRKQKKHVLVLLYQPDVLMQLLQVLPAKKLLGQCGYDAAASLDELLAQLCYRFQTVESVPHEIGLFLGYPPNDVAGFIHNKGQNYIFTGYWKVYDNEESIRRLFQVYNNCIQQVCKELNDGVGLKHMICRAAQ